MRFILRAAALATLLAHTAPGTSWAGKDSVVVALMQEHADTQGERSGLIDKLQQALLDARSPKESLDVRLVLAEQQRLIGKLDEATANFVMVANHSKGGALVPAAQLGLTLTAIAKRGYKDTDETALQTLESRHAPSTMNAYRHLQLARNAHGAGAMDAFREHSAKALVYAVADPTVEMTVTARLSTLGAQDQSMATAGALHPLEQADLALQAGQTQTAIELASAVLSESAPGDAMHEAARATLLRANGSPAKPVVALMLPLEDERYSAVARQLQEAFVYGYETSSGAWDVVVVDSGADDIGIEEAIKQAVTEEGASVLVGPLLTGQAVAAAGAAEAMRTPLLSLSKGIEDASAYGFVFQMSTTLADEVNALVDHAMEKESMRSFAAFAPQTPYGERAVALFTEAAELRGGEVTVSDFYDPTTTDLLADAQQLGRKDYESRGREFREVRKAIEEEGGDPSKAVLPPLVDFDAIFLPERASRVPLACAALAYEEFPMGDFRPISDSPTVPLLGLSGWNQAKLTQSGGPYVRGSRFVDIFALPIKNGRWSFSAEESAWLDGYREAHGRTLTSLEASTLDVGVFLAQALAKLPEVAPPALVRDTIVGHTMDASLTRLMGVDSDTRHALRELRVLTMNSREIFPAPVPETPTAPDSVDD